MYNIPDLYEMFPYFFPVYTEEDAEDITATTDGKSTYNNNLIGDDTQKEALNCLQRITFWLLYFRLQSFLIQSIQSSFEVVQPQLE